MTQRSLFFLEKTTARRQIHVYQYVLSKVRRGRLKQEYPTPLTARPYTTLHLGCLENALQVYQLYVYTVAFSLGNAL